MEAREYDSMKMDDDRNVHQIISDADLRVIIRRKIFVEPIEFNQRKAPRRIVIGGTSDDSSRSAGRYRSIALLANELLALFLYSSQFFSFNDMSQLDSNHFIMFAVQTDRITEEQSFSSLIRVNTLISVLLPCLKV